MRKNIMANKDGTGPEGKGPRTGRQMGNCERAEPLIDKDFGCRPCGCGRGRWFKRQAKVED
jgi:hypothetical protein